MHAGGLPVIRVACVVVLAALCVASSVVLAEDDAANGGVVDSPRATKDPQRAPKQAPAEKRATAKRGEAKSAQDELVDASPGRPVGVDALERIEKRLDEIVERIAGLERDMKGDDGRTSVNEAVARGEMLFRVADADFRFVYIPAGTFRFGYPAEDEVRVVQATGNPNAFLNASPENVIRVTRGYFMLDREVTVGQWEACVAAGRGPGQKDPDETGATQVGETSKSPKRKLTWLEANSFCKALQRAAEGLSPDSCEVRLPTEIEWEYAARGSQGRAFPWPISATSPPTYLGNAKGIANASRAVDEAQNKDLSWRSQFDFGGNLSEWCLDRYDQDLHETLRKRQGPDALVLYDPADDEIVEGGQAENKADANPSRTFRGGSFLDPVPSCELPMRRSLLQNRSADQLGVRPVIVIKPVD